MEPDTSGLKLTKERAWSVRRKKGGRRAAHTEAGRRTGAGKGGCGEGQGGGGQETVTLLRREVKGWGPRKGHLP